MRDKTQHSNSVDLSPSSASLPVPDEDIVADDAKNEDLQVGGKRLGLPPVFLVVVLLAAHLGKGASLRLNCETVRWRSGYVCGRAGARRGGGSSERHDGDVDGRRVGSVPGLYDG